MLDGIPLSPGTYNGRLGSLPVTVHVVKEAGGRSVLTIDSPNQGGFGIQCDDVILEGPLLRFSAPSIGASWSGTLQADAITLSGTWTQQGHSAPLDLVRDTFVPAAVPSPVDGIWLGNLAVDKHTLRIQLIVKTDEAGNRYVSLDSIDQRATGFLCTEIIYDDGHFSFEVPSIRGRWEGTLSADAQQMAGHWRQNAERPLTFARQTHITRVEPLPPPRILAAVPRVAAAEVGPLLARDLEGVLTTGWLARGRAGGVAIGIVQGKERSIVTLGAATDQSIFEIGSITKTFTGLVLAQMVVQARAGLEEPVRHLLPAGVVEKCAESEITLLDLSTHHSGLPRLPDNLWPADPEDPYAAYGEEKLHQFLAVSGTGKSDHPGFNYSNLGVGLLGYALAKRAGVSFAKLLKEQITDPLGMHDTAIMLTPESKLRFMQGHKADGSPARPWDLNVLAGAGGLRASVRDMLTYLEAFLDPQRIKGAPGSAGSTLIEALHETQKSRVELTATSSICLGWHFEADGGTYWHTGGTGGFTSYAAYSRERNRAIVVMANIAGGNSGSAADRIGRYVVERLDGRPAMWPGHAFPS